MNLKRLLSVGGSLEARKGAGGRYRMAPVGVLPKFELRGDTLTAVPMEGVVRAKTTPAKASPGPLFDTPVEPVVVKAQPVEPSVPVASAVVVANPFSAEAPRTAAKTGFAKRLLDSIGAVLSDAFSGRKNRARRRAVRATVQGELGLDSVCPLHNDLSGSDFEVVAAPVPRPGLRLRETAVSSPAGELPAERRPETRLLGAKD